jgi:hypothetical protein
MSDTGQKAYHERTANGNSRIVVLIKNFHCGLISDFCRGVVGETKAQYGLLEKGWV